MKKISTETWVFIIILVWIILVNDRGRAEEERKAANAMNVQDNVVFETDTSEKNPSSEIAFDSPSFDAEAPVVDSDPYSKEWFSQILYSAKQPSENALWTLSLTIGDTDGEVLIEANFKSIDLAPSLGSLICQQVSDHPDETLILYANGFLGEQVLYLKIPANRETA